MVLLMKSDRISDSGQHALCDSSTSTRFSEHITSKRFLGIFAAILSALSFGILGFFTKQAYASGLSVSGTLAWRFAVASIGMLLLAQIKTGGVGKGAYKERLKNMLFGASGLGTSAFLFFVSMKHTTTGIANLLLFQNPLVVFFLSCFFQKSFPGTLKICAMGATLCGITLVSIPSGLGIEVNQIGIWAGLTSAFTYGIYLFFSEKRCSQQDPYWLAADVILGTCAFFILLSLMSGQLTIPVQNDVWFSLLVLGLLCTVIPIFTLLYAVKSLGARDATIISSLEPVITFSVGAMFLHEPVFPLQVLGGCIVVTSVLFVILHQSPPKKA
jgi:drug/metabolite transporter (DMT)-like permease